jgi:GntR family transcriptional regulator
MIVQIDHHSGVAIYRQIVDQARRQILTGIVSEGSQMPTVRDMAADLKVNPMTVSKAYGLLENEGFLERRRGIGLFVKSNGQFDEDKIKREILEKLISKTVFTAIQFGISASKLSELVNSKYRKISEDQINNE